MVHSEMASTPCLRRFRESDADPGFLISGSTDLEKVFGVTKKGLNKSEFPNSTPLEDFRGSAKWIFRIFKGKNKKW